MRGNIRRAALGTVGILAAIGAGIAGAQERVSGKLATAYPSTLSVLGPAPFETAEILATIPGGTLDIRVYEPGALVPPLETFDAVAKGAVDAGYTAGTFWAGKDVTSTSSPPSRSVPQPTSILPGCATAAASSCRTS